MIEFVHRIERVTVWTSPNGWEEFGPNEPGVEMTGAWLEELDTQSFQAALALTAMKGTKVDLYWSDGRHDTFTVGDEWTVRYETRMLDNIVDSQFARMLI